jgi:hypothetical protein
MGIEPGRRMVEHIRESLEGWRHQGSAAPGHRRTSEERKAHLHRAAADAQPLPLGFGGAEPSHRIAAPKNAAARRSGARRVMSRGPPLWIRGPPPLTPRPGGRPLHDECFLRRCAPVFLCVGGEGSFQFLRDGSLPGDRGSHENPEFSTKSEKG